MKKGVLLLMCLSFFFGCSGMYSLRQAMPADRIDSIYREAKLQDTVDEELFALAMKGYSRIRPKEDTLISIIDFSKPSTEKRFYVIDLAKKKLLFHTYTSHGVNTGEDMALAFSNIENSRQSSLGFYLTAETYEGKHGRSLKLDGLEQGFNNNARRRYIVIHSADYVTEEFIRKNGRLGRSWGCPALPPDLAQDIIDQIKEGSVLFIYANDPKYLERSKLIR